MDENERQPQLFHKDLLPAGNRPAESREGSHRGGSCRIRWELMGIGAIVVILALAGAVMILGNWLKEQKERRKK